MCNILFNPLLFHRDILNYLAVEDIKSTFHFRRFICVWPATRTTLKARLPRSKKRVWSKTHKRYSLTRKGTLTGLWGLQIAGLLSANGFTAVPDARLSNLEFHCRAIRRVSPRWRLHLGAQGGYPHRTACPACSAMSKCLEVSARSTVDHFGGL